MAKPTTLIADACVDGTGAAVDLSGWTTECAVEFFMADVDVEARRPGHQMAWWPTLMLLTNFKSTDDPPRNLTSSVSDAAAGEVVGDLAQRPVAPINPDVDATPYIGLRDFVHSKNPGCAQAHHAGAVLIYRRGPS